MILSYYLLLFILFFPSITCKVLRYYFKTCFKIMIVFVKKKMFAIKKKHIFDKAIKGCID